MHKSLIYKLLTALIICTFLSNCSTPIVTVKKNFDPAKINRIAILDFNDFPKRPNSGELLSADFEKYMLTTSLDIVEREQVGKVLQEQSLSASGVVDTKTAEQIGSILGVDALIIGSITEFTPEKENKVYVDMQSQTQVPIYGNNGRVIGFQTKNRNYKVPEEKVIDAKVGLALRMIDIRTGQILLIASHTETSSHVEDAAESLCKDIAKALDKKFSK